MKNSIFKWKVVQCKILKCKKLTLTTFCGKKLPFATRGTSVDNAGGWGDHSNLIFWNVLDWSWYQDVTMPSKNLDSSELRGNLDCRWFLEEWMCVCRIFHCRLFYETRPICCRVRHVCWTSWIFMMQAHSLGILKNIIEMSNIRKCRKLS